MREFWNTIQLVFTAVGGWLGWFLGGSDGLLFALIAFVVIDYITGVMCAISDKKLSSAVGFKGICRKVLIFALVGDGHILDTRVIGAGSVLRTAVIFFYLSNEAAAWWAEPRAKISYRECLAPRIACSEKAERCIGAAAQAFGKGGR